MITAGLKSRILCLQSAPIFRINVHFRKAEKAVCQLSLMFPIIAIKCDNRIIEGLIHNDTRSPIPDPFYMKETFVYPNWLGSLTEIPQERLIYDLSAN